MLGSLLSVRLRVVVLAVVCRACSLVNRSVDVIRQPTPLLLLIISMAVGVVTLSVLYSLSL